MDSSQPPPLPHSPINASGTGRPTYPVIVDGNLKKTARRAPPQGAPCVDCGHPVEANDRYCAACGKGHVQELSHREPHVSAKSEQGIDVQWPRPEQAPYPDQQRFQCKNCGSEVALDPGQVSYACPFCDSNYVVEIPTSRTGRRAPEFIIGFAVSPEQAEEKFGSWISQNAWFRPGDLNRAQLAQKIHGVYIPFWNFSMLAQSRWQASIGEHWYRTETYTTRDKDGKIRTHTRVVQETEWWPLQGQHHQYYSGYLVSGSRGLAQGEADEIKPFHLSAMKRYEPYFLAGWMCEEYSVAHDDALEICQHEFLHREQQEVQRFMPGDTFHNLDVQTTFSHINSDLCLLPVYVLSYQYQGKLFRFLVNGQTGEMAGKKPVSAKRITLAMVVVVVIVVLLIILIGMMSR